MMPPNQNWDNANGREVARKRVPPVVAIGAPAGGLEAYRKLFKAMPTDSGMAFVVIQHLDPSHDSLLSELIGRHVGIPVVVAEDAMPVIADRIHVIPPNAVMTIADGRLRLAVPEDANALRSPIDTFFASLAEDRGENAIAVVLSGAGSDGAVGLRAVKAHGGLTIAQAFREPTDGMAFDSMPRAAEATGAVDWVLPVEEIAAHLVDYLRRRRGLTETTPNPGEATEHLPAICALLHEHLGHDFSLYKRNTLLRRVWRRMQVLGIETMAGYVQRLRDHPGELDLLLRDLLIGVTQFFRDPDAYRALQTVVIPKILDAGREEVRVWVPGCATGEEAYSIAILLYEAVEQRAIDPRVRIYATEIDDEALQVARTGKYPATITGHLSPARLARFFVRDGDGYRIARSIRELCTFSTHNVIRDPPLSRLDLISCRNLLIYFSAELQRQVMPILHYALRPGGFLFLGESENVGQFGDLFSAVDKKHRIFRRDNVHSRLFDMPRGGGRTRSTAWRAASRPPARGDEGALAERIVLDEFSPPFVVVDANCNVIRYSERTGGFLEPPASAPVANLIAMARKGLRLHLRAALGEAVSSRRRVVRDEVTVSTNGSRQPLRLIVEPMATGDGAERYLIVFQDMSHGRKPDEDEAASEPGRHLAETYLADLERELAMTREHLQTMVEELETSNEELQSSNEELHTVNSELSAKVDELGHANDDLKNLFDNTKIPLVFLDRGLGIRNFTPAATDIFRIVPGDIGRPITDLGNRLDYDGLEDDLHQVLETSRPREREVSVRGAEASYLVRMTPYRTIDGRIDGVVAAFVDITERRRGEAERSNLAAIVDAAEDPIIRTDLEGNIMTWNSGAERRYGYSVDDVIGRPQAMLLPSGQAEADGDIIGRLRGGETALQLDSRRLTRDGRILDVSASISPICDARGRLVALSSVERDITDQKRAEHRQALLLAELDHRVKNILATVQSIAAHSIATTTSLDTFRDSFTGRIRALADTHTLLTRGHWQGAPLAELVAVELQPYRARDGENLTIAGERVLLKPRAALTLGMTLHELATNAVKYGALSREGGRILVDWQVDGNGAPPWLTLRWQEREGPPVEPPTGAGFGRRLIEQAVSYELGGEAELEFRPDGLVCILRVPLNERVGSVAPADDTV